MNAYAATDPFAPLEPAGFRSRSEKTEEPDDWLLLPVPDDTPELPRAFGKLGSWSKSFPYHRASGELDGYMLRFDTAAGKETRPLRYGQRWGRIGWHIKGWAGDDARPLYRLPELLAAPDVPVLLCEGEKTADAAADLLDPAWAVIASMNGAQSPHRSDWSPVAGRNLVIWPDNDETGQAYALAAAALALKAGAGSVRIVDVPDTLPTGWDLADPIPDSVELDLEELLSTAPKFDPDGEEQGTFRVQWRRAGELMPGLHCRAGDKADPETGELVSDWHWFASRLDILGHTRDADNRAWGKYLAIHDPDRRVHHIAMPAAMTAGDGTEYRRILLDHGLTLAPGKAAREKLEVYLTMWKPKHKVRCVPRIGWHGERFVLPDRTFGPGGETVVLQTERPVKFKLAGTLAEWRELVAKPAIGNSRIAFGTAASFAGPLLEWLGQESGGFHFQGASSIGKTSTLRAARSVWGCPLGSWRSTDNGAEGLVAAACDTLFLLDEVSQANPHAVENMAYMLANGAGKSRAGRNGEARAVTSWRILFLSTGELSLADKMAETGKRARAGQSVRVIDIPADAGKGLGVFDTLHGFAGGAALADHLRRAGEAHSGHAARAFLEEITGDLPATVEALRAYMAKWLAANTPDGSDGQVGRVAARFALVAAAGELATALGILPWPAGEASDAAARCCSDWLAARGDNGPEEITAGLRQVRAFLEMYGSSRFEEPWSRSVSVEDCWVGPVQRTAIIRAGFRRQDQDENWEFFVLPEAWRGEVCKGRDPAAIAKAMIAKGWMRKGDEKNLAQKVRVPGAGSPRLYCINSSFLAGEEA